MKSFPNLLQYHKDNNLGFAIYKWPQSSELFFISGSNNTNCTEGFVFSNFDSVKNQNITLDPIVKLSSPSIDGILRDAYSSLKIQEEPIPDTAKQTILGTLKTVDTTFEQYRTGFDFIKQKINEGIVQKTILSTVKSTPFNFASIPDAFLKLIEIHDQAMCSIFYHPISGLWIGASPELILRQEGRKYKTSSIAGTKNTSKEEWGQKEIDEQKIVTDFIINSLEDINSTYKLSQLQTVKAGDIYHLKRLIEFEIPPTASLNDLVKKLHPTPAIGGYPKEKALKTINETEDHSREFYCGYLGELHQDQTRLYVNLRCARVFDNQIQVFAGGGLTKESILEKEWEECQRKANAIFGVI